MERMALKSPVPEDLKERVLQRSLILTNTYRKAYFRSYDSKFAALQAALLPGWPTIREQSLLRLGTGSLGQFARSHVCDGTYWKFSAIVRELCQFPSAENTVRPSREAAMFATHGTGYLFEAYDQHPSSLCNGQDRSQR